MSRIPVAMDEQVLVHRLDEFRFVKHLHLRNVSRLFSSWKDKALQASFETVRGRGGGASLSPTYPGLPGQLPTSSPPLKPSSAHQCSKGSCGLRQGCN